MISGASIMDEPSYREAEHDRRRQLRDSMLCALEDAGRPMTPAELGQRLGIAACAITIAACRSPAYFDARWNGKRIVSIDRHPHLKIGA